MSYIHHTILVSILSSQIALSNDSINSNNISQIHFDIKSLYAPEVPEEIRKKIIDEISQQQQNSNPKKTESFTEKDIEEMEFVFEASPEEAQCIVNYLYDPNYFPGVKEYRSVFFVGEPGTGKSVTAKAIAHKMCQKGWEYKFLSSTSFLREYRNQTAIQLQKELEKIESSNKPTILIIDEIHRLLENTESKHHDTDATATALWTFLDRQKNNNNFFLIGTMNRIHKLPKPVKSRILSDFIEFPLMTDPIKKNNILRRNLSTQNSQINTEITESFLIKELEKINPYSGRDLEKLSKEILVQSKLNSRNQPYPITITQNNISQGMNSYLRKRTIIQYDIEEETDDERQERHHKETLEMHEKHFIQQQKISIAIHDHQNEVNNNVSSTHMNRESRAHIDSLISDEQNQLYKNMMANTETRKAQEAAEKKAAEEKAAAEKARINTENSFGNQIKKLFS
ncbi:MAG TPA: AAA family ATPase [Candidatus Babeliales bacterium]|nr:AAA family ATPase [Candidatus Babeliales bacterium]